jgi:hypothetical protein
MDGWQVVIGPRVQKKMVLKLPELVQLQLLRLVKEIGMHGPIRGNWPNYSALGGGRHHCHLKKGRPTYVACWAVQDKSVRLVEVYYAGTHEKAPY